MHPAVSTDRHTLYPTSPRGTPRHLIRDSRLERDRLTSSLPSDTFSPLLRTCWLLTILKRKSLLQTAPASSQCPQLCTPTSEAGQSLSLLSVPLQDTSSSQIEPVFCPREERYSGSLAGRRINGIAYSRGVPINRLPLYIHIFFVSLSNSRQVDYLKTVTMVTYRSFHFALLVPLRGTPAVCKQQSRLTNSIRRHTHSPTPPRGSTPLSPRKVPPLPPVVCPPRSTC